MRSIAGVALLLSGLCAAYLLHHEHSGVLGNTDTYSYFLPNMLYAVRAMQDGGHGLLWNPFQACGAPFLANLQVGLFYPPHWLFFVLDPDTALRAVLVIDMTLAGLWTYLLCIELGLGPMSALAAAVLVAAGPTGAWLARWSPIHVGPWAWLPAAMYCTERLLRQPTLQRTIALAVALAMGILPGFPQIVLFTYQLVGFRLLWQVLRPSTRRRFLLVTCVAVAAVLPLGLAAVQLVPSIELVRESVRGRDLPAGEIHEGAKRVVESVLVQLRGRAIMGAPIDILTLLLAPLALLRSPTVSAARFYCITFLLAWSLRLGPGTPVYDLYARLPLASMFQHPSRFVWLADFCVAMLTALGLANVARMHDALRQSGRRFALLSVMGMMALLIVSTRFISWLTFEPIVLLSAAVLLFAVLAGARHTVVVPAVLLALLAGEVFLRPPGPLHSLGPSEGYRARAASLAVAQQSVTPMDRVLILHRRGFEVTQELILKTAMLFSLHSVADYEALPTRQFAEVFSMMMMGRLPTGVWDVQLTTSSPAITPATNRRLLDLLATRLVLSDPSRGDEVATLSPPLTRQLDAADLRIDLNAAAFPRAFVVPSVVVVPDGRARLARLANGTDDLRQVALLDAPPADGFVGAEGGEASAATMVADEPDRVTIEAASATRAFLVLTDQWYPGWRATVNGVATPILRANHAFRAVEIPAGPARVEFVYRPRSVVVGALITAMCLGASAIVCWPRRRRGRGRSLRFDDWDLISTRRSWR